MHRRAGFCVVLLLAGGCSAFDAVEPAHDVPDASDGGGDGQAGPSDAGGCEHAFCASFDGQDLAAGWDTSFRYLNASGLALARTAESPSAGPFALRASVAAGAHAGGYYLRKGFAGAPTRMTLDLRVRVVKSSTKSEDLVVAAIAWGPPSPDGTRAHRTSLLVSTQRLFSITGTSADGGTTRSDNGGRAFVAQQWHQVHIEVVPEDGKVRVAFALDGALLSQGSLVEVGEPFVDPELRVGAVGVFGDFTDATVDIDELSADVSL